jgi:hypothetical protein
MELSSKSEPTYILSELQTGTQSNIGVEHDFENVLDSDREMLWMAS